MRNDVVTFAVDAAVAPELALAASGLAEGLGAVGRGSEVLVNPGRDALRGLALAVEVGDLGQPDSRWRLDLGTQAELELIDPAGKSHPLPLALPSLPGATATRILFIGGGAGRRTRMMGKTFEALRRRGSGVAVWRALPDELIRQRFRGEVYAEVSGPELARLLASAAVLVEVSDEATAEGMLVAAIGRASGIPTVIHAALPAKRWDGCTIVAEWSGEAFAEAALEATTSSRNAAVAAAIRREAGAQLAELLSR